MQKVHHKTTKQYYIPKPWQVDSAYAHANADCNKDEGEESKLARNQEHRAT